MSASSLDRDPLPEERYHEPAATTDEALPRSPTNIIRSHPKGLLSYMDGPTRELLERTAAELESIRQAHEYLVERCTVPPDSRRQSLPELTTALGAYIPRDFEELGSQLDEAYHMMVQGEPRQARAVIEEVKGDLRPLVRRNRTIANAVDRLAEEGLMRAL